MSKDINDIPSNLINRFVGTLLVLFVMFVQAAHAQQNTSPKPQLRASEPPTVRAVPQTEITPPPSIAAYAKPDSVVLQAGRSSTVLQALPVKRQFSVAELRTNPVFTLGTTTVDMTPVFSVPSSPLNVATRMRNQPALVQVIAEDTQIIEVQQGLVIRHFLTYRTKSGVCSNPARRILLLQSGARCFTRMNDQARTAAFANPSDLRYIPDRAKRAQALATSRAAAANYSEIVGDLAKFRTMLATPVERAKVEAEIGASETSRLAVLSDAQLEVELVNTAEIQIEQIMFVPAGFKKSTPSLTDMQNNPVPKILFPENVDLEKSLQQHIFLTGFTLGQEYEWRHRVSVSIKWCVVGCKKTYFAEVYAGFDYGFGLRFPIQMGGLYAYHRSNNQETASIAPVFQPIDGTESDYAKSGLPANKLFEGKELVAEFNSYAGMSYKVPVLGSGGARLDVGKDFTEGLPAPFTNGQFRPPAVGDADPPKAEIIFDSVDLIGGRANFGVAGAKVFPAVKVSLISDLLRLKLTDKISGQVTVMENAGQTYPLAVNAEDHSSEFSIGYPEYNLNFEVTPGLNARLFIDVEVWSNNWAWPVWFPQMTISLPPGGGTFACHENTVCSRDYRYSPTVTIDEIGDVALPQEEPEREVQRWRNSFLQKWRPQCLYEKIKICDVAIDLLAKGRGNRMINQMNAENVAPPDTKATQIIIREIIDADKQASEIILNSKFRDIERYGKSLAELYDPVWSKNCADQGCHSAVHDICGQFVKALADRQMTSPDVPRSEVLFLEHQEGKWSEKAKQEVAASQQRTKTVKRQVPKTLKRQEPKIIKKN